MLRQWWIGALVVGAGCAFIQNATTLTFGEEQLPNIDQAAVFSVAEVNEALVAAVEAGTSEIGIQLEPSDNWKDLRNVLCNAAAYGAVTGPQLTFDEEVENEANLKSAKMSVLVDRDLNNDGEDETGCQAGGIRAEVDVEFVPFDETQAQELRDSLNQELDVLEDAILQIRFRFDTLGLMEQPAGAGIQMRNDQLSLLQVQLIDPAIEDDPETPFVDGTFDLVPFFLLDTIEEKPQRFELDPDSPVTQSLKDAIVNPGARSLVLRIVAEIPPEQLGHLPVEDSGVALTFQPEITISALDVVL